MTRHLSGVVQISRRCPIQLSEWCRYPQVPCTAVRSGAGTPQVSWTAVRSGAVTVPCICPGQLSGVVQIPRRCPIQLLEWCRCPAVADLTELANGWRTILLHRFSKLESDSTVHRGSPGGRHHIHCGVRAAPLPHHSYHLPHGSYQKFGNHSLSRDGSQRNWKRTIKCIIRGAPYFL